MNLLPLPNHVARIKATLAAQLDERASLMARLQAAADSGDEGDGLARQIEDLDRDIARTRIKLTAGEAAQQRDREVEQAKAQAKARKQSAKQVDEYQADAEFVEQGLQGVAEGIGRMRERYAAFLAAHPDRDALAYARALTPDALVERMLEAFRERIARQVKRADSTMPASSARIERMSVADAFGSKRAALLPWLQK